jgi:protein-S-isoprenylcysteine O-methyltransferase Ste14
MWMTIMLLVCSLWFLSEIAIAFLTRSKRSESRSYDKNSMGKLWIVIILSVMVGVYIANVMPMYNALEYFIGLAMILLGIIIRLIAIFSLKKYFTSNVSIHQDHKLKTNGIYSRLRHPSYTGALISFLGLGLSQGNWISLIVIFLPVLTAFLYRINIEEKVLSENFGEEYRQYIKKTKKLIPFLY